jgi:hypothetical protein
MAPTLAMSLTGSGPAGLIGRAAPLAFAAATVGVLVVASGFVRLSAEFFSAGSVYGFVRGSLGPRSGFVTGWALLGTYLVFPAVSIAGIALFSRAVLSLTGLSADADWFWPALAGWAFVALLAGLGVQPTSRFLLLAEGVSCLLILGVVAAVAVKLGSGTAPRGQSLSLDVVRLPPRNVRRDRRARRDFRLPRLRRLRVGRLAGRGVAAPSAGDPPLDAARHHPGWRLLRDHDVRPNPRFRYRCRRRAVVRILAYSTR